MVVALAFDATACAWATSEAPSQTPSPASSAKSQDPLDRKSPQSAAIAFLDACKAGDYARAMRYLDLRHMTVEQRRKEGPVLARDLAAILERDAEFDVAALSRDPEGDKHDSKAANRERLVALNLEGQAFELFMERVELRASEVYVWLIAPDSVDLIPKLAQLTSENLIERHLPPP